MKISDLLRLSLRNLGRRKGRTALTVMGIVVGTCLVIVMISLGIAQNYNYEQMLMQWGELTQIEIYGYGYIINADGTVGEQVTLDDDAVANISQLSNVVAATPYYYPYRINGTISAGRNDRYQTGIYNAMGLYPEALEPMGFELTDGEWFVPGQSYGRNVIPIIVCESTGYNFEDTRRDWSSDKRYRWEGMTDANGNPLPPFVDVQKDDMTLTIADYEGKKSVTYKLKVVGTLKQDTAKGWWTRSSFVMRIEDIRMLEAEYYDIIGEKNPEQSTYDQVYVKVDDVNHVESVTQALNDMGFQNTYSISDQRESMQAQVARSQLMLGGIAAVSLLVAALNIANTMTMAIVERTKEIGIMKVLGCRLGSIRTLFLFESGSIGFLGGAIGCVISLGVSYFLNHLTLILMWLQSMGQNFNMWEILGDSYYYMGDDNVLSIVPLWLILLALGFSTAIGLIFGLLPANRAVKISALEAIRHD